ncbi:MAG: glycerol dehydrogenase [Oscillatoriales cyanobacterium CG2_30_44_21]|nr:MAG: glycerol dehydrogenase [Oscillatoriales cyanobacterium CG2_30_44_21]
MTTSTPSISSNNASETTELKPSYAIPIVLVVAAIPLVLIQPIAAGVVGIFGLFLSYQAATIRLVFTDVDLEVYRSQKKFRTFPYQDWQNWQIFWSFFPVLFYFKEIKSIHFLPILFDAKALKTCLEKYVVISKE